MTRFVACQVFESATTTGEETRNPEEPQDPRRWFSGCYRVIAGGAAAQIPDTLN